MSRNDISPQPTDVHLRSRMRFVGVDVAEARGCAIAVLDDVGHLRDAHWVQSEPTAIATAVEKLRGSADTLTIGIDSPRTPLAVPRPWYWDGRVRRWRARGPREQGWGRHCEVVVRSLGLAVPQWTPLAHNAPGWMRLGFQLFSDLEEYGTVHEVFPSAAYAQLCKRDKPAIRLSFREFNRGPKDMLDAVIAALTVAEYAAGRGVAVGGGDGLGSIVLPCSIGACPSQLLKWPSSQPAN